MNFQPTIRKKQTSYLRWEKMAMVAIVVFLFLMLIVATLGLAGSPTVTSL